MNWDFIWPVAAGCIVGMIAVLIILGISDVVTSGYYRALK